jgi:hypothetical protein
VVVEEREAVADCDVARCVLARQGVIEDSVERSDSPFAVDEAELAESARTRVDFGEARERLCVPVGIDLDRNAVFKADSEPTDDRPVVEDERLDPSADRGPRVRRKVAIREFDVPAGSGLPPPHSHDAYEETIYGVAGTVTFTV